MIFRKQALPQVFLTLCGLFAAIYLGHAALAGTRDWRTASREPAGLAGATLGVEEGLEVNLLGLTFGIDPRSLSPKLPLIGRLGPGGDAAPVILQGHNNSPVSGPPADMPAPAAASALSH